MMLRAPIPERVETREERLGLVDADPFRGEHDARMENLDRLMGYCPMAQERQARDALYGEASGTVTPIGVNRPPVDCRWDAA